MNVGKSMKEVRGFKGWLRGALAMFVALQLVAGAWAGVAGAASDDSAAGAKASIRGQVGQAVDGLQALLGKSQPSSDWVAFGLARSGATVGAAYLSEAAKSADSGSLRLVTDFARVALAVNAVGGDVRKVGSGKTDLLGKIANFDKITAQGPNAPAYALLALDAAGYVPGTNDKWSRDDLVKWLVDHRTNGGGWSLTAGKSDTDITGIVLSALAGYQDSPEVKSATEEALKWLSSVQLANGGFGGAAESSESAAQVVIALTSLGIDPVNDARFSKDGKSALTRLLEFRLADGQFSHTFGGKADGMASYYALLGLTAAERWLDGLPGLYAGVNATSKVQVTVNGVSGTVANGSVTGKTALEALVNALNASKLAYKVERYSFGPMLTSIGGLDSAKFGGYDGWNYGVKRGGAWVTITEGMGTFALKQGDELVVYYGGAETSLIHSVKLEPAAPRAGQPVTVTVEKETFDWDANKLVVSPAEDVNVKLGGGVSAKTDKDGKATLTAPQAGAYVLAIGGYRTDAVPTVVASSVPVKVATYEKNVSVRVEGDAGVTASGIAQGGTAFQAIEQLLKAKGVKYEVKESSFGKYINSIDGIAGGKYGGYDGWSFAVVRGGDWIIPAVGTDAFLLEDGDEVVIYYSGSTTLLVDPIVLSPAQPKPGQAFTVTVTNRAWDWENGKFEAAKPIAGATVTVGQTSVITDPNGKASFAGQKEGYYTVEVTGYTKDAAPSVARSVTGLSIAGAYKDQSAVAAWAADAVATARSAKLLRGIGDGTESFKPKQAVTRAEFVSALARGLGLSGKAASAFKDVPTSAWYAKDVNAAVAAGLISGVSATSFAPDATLTREQAAILLTRALKLKATAVAELADAKQITPSAVSAVQAVIQQGWLTPYEGRFAPKATLTREQAATVIVRVWHASGK
ncbi:S-layer homology domain-containing protein [Cohnella soli]|uniref:S-layer homology domain-containing protein n=1 Tax=Cohnella soli TaxID=425005 RepID=A0ABW0HNU9_9BACL